MNKTILYIVCLILFFGGMVWWSKGLQKNDPDIVSRTGIHWHSTLSILVNGEKREVSPNIGITGGTMMPMHTHDPTGEIHVEKAGIIRRSDLTLSQFFKIWGRDIDSFGSNVRTIVNDVENAELGDYIMQDGDKIELRYE